MSESLNVVHAPVSGINGVRVITRTNGTLPSVGGPSLVNKAERLAWTSLYSGAAACNFGLRMTANGVASAAKLS